MHNTNIEPELNSLRTKLAVEIENDSNQIALLQKRIDKNQALLAAVKGSLAAMHPDAKTTGYGSKSEVIWEAIGQIPKAQFTQDDVQAELKRAHPEMEIDRNRIRASLWTLANKRQWIKAAILGSNQQPAVYEKVRTKRVTQQDMDQTLRNAGLDSNGKSTAQLSASVLEDAVRTKSGRIDSLAKRLNTDEPAIRKLLEPASKVYVDIGGWLRVRE